MDAFAEAEFPPDTWTEFVCGDVAFPATVTVTVIDGKLAPPAIVFVVVHVGNVVQVHPVPAIAVIVSPVGGVSTTVTVPTVVPAPAAFDTVTVYCAPASPCVNVPLGVFVMLSEGTRMAVGAGPVAVPVKFPPVACTEFVSIAFAVNDTFTVTVIAG
jgi:hypothetical protein